jgi:hypothetical protein
MATKTRSGKESDFIGASEKLFSRIFPWRERQFPQSHEPGQTTCDSAFEELNFINFPQGPSIHFLA